MKGDRLGEFEELVLLCVRSLGPERAWANEIQDALARDAQREVTLGAIYSALDRAHRKGLADSWLADPPAGAPGRARRHYRLTDEGVEALETSRQVREALWLLGPEGA